MKIKGNMKYLPANPIAEFEDKYGDRKIIHKPKGRSLRVWKDSETPALLMNRAVAVLLGNRIKAARERAGLTMEELGLRAGLASATPKQYVWGIENAVRGEGVRLGTLYVIAKALNVRVGDLLPEVGEAAEMAGVETKQIAMVSV